MEAGVSICASSLNPNFHNYKHHQKYSSKAKAVSTSAQKMCRNTRGHTELLLNRRWWSQDSKPGRQAQSLHCQPLPCPLGCPTMTMWRKEELSWVPSSHSESLTILPRTSFLFEQPFSLWLTHSILLACPDPLSSLLCPRLWPICTCSLRLVRFGQWEAHAGDLRTQRRRHGAGTPGSLRGKSAAPFRQPLLQLFLSFPVTLPPSALTLSLPPPSCLIWICHLLLDLSPSQPAAMA